MALAERRLEEDSMQTPIHWNPSSGSWQRRGGALAGLLGVLLAACGPEPLALEHEVYEVDGGVESLVDAGCNELPEGPGAAFGFGFGTAPSVRPVAYTVSYLFETERVLVAAGPAGSPGLLELSDPTRVSGGSSADADGAIEREYDAAFLASDEVDEVAVALGASFGLRLVNRGVPGCSVSSGVPPFAGQVPSIGPQPPPEL